MLKLGGWVFGLVLIANLLPSESPLFVLLWMAFGVWLIWRSNRTSLAMSTSSGVVALPPASMWDHAPHTVEAEEDDDDEENLTEVAVVGESNYIETMNQLVAGQVKKGPYRIGAQFQLVDEPENVHDNKAVAVRYLGKTVGYLPRATARSWRAYCKARKQNVNAQVEGVISGVFPDGYGIWIDLPGDHDA
jgi:hypothetical protein